MTLPILLSIPHGGTKKPVELDGHLDITPHDQFDDSDPFVKEIYDLGDRVQEVISADIARAFVDLNRDKTDRAPANPDGAIKSMTCYKKSIYKTGKEPDEKLANLLIDKYHTPYHKKIQDLVQNVKVSFDCHSMASVAPLVAPDKARRPLFCISNGEGATCSQEMLDALGQSLVKAFDVAQGEVLQNYPFKGGYITRRHGSLDTPWIQIEMNRSLYLDEKWFDRETLHIDESRLSELNERFYDAVKLFCENVHLV